MVVFDKLKKWFSDWPYGTGIPGERGYEACKRRFEVIYGDLIEPTTALVISLCLVLSAALITLEPLN